MDLHTYCNLCQIDLIHHWNNPYLHQTESTVVDPNTSQQFPENVSLAEDEEWVEEQEQEEEIILMRTNNPLYWSENHHRRKHQWGRSSRLPHHCHHLRGHLPQILSQSNSVGCQKHTKSQWGNSGTSGSIDFPYHRYFLKMPILSDFDIYSGIGCPASLV